MQGGGCGQLATHDARRPAGSGTSDRQDAMTRIALARGRSYHNLSSPLIFPSHPLVCSTNATMQAIKLQRKYPEVSQEEMFDLINRFKYALYCLRAE